MDVSLNFINISSDAYAYAHRISDEELTKNFLDDVRRHLNIVYGFLDNNLDKLNDSDFLSIIESLYCVMLDEYDYLGVISREFNKNYIGYTTIKTCMVSEVMQSEGHGRSFDYWEEEVFFNLNVIYSDNFKMDYNHRYTKAEIIALVDSRDIIVLGEEIEEVYDIDEYEKEEYYKFDFYRMHKDLKKNSSFIIEELRKIINSAVLRRDLIGYVEEIQDDIRDVLLSADCHYVKGIKEGYSDSGLALELDTSLTRIKKIF